MRLFLLLGSINMALSIALGAFGAHGLKGKVAEKMIANWNTGAHYHMIHALGMLIVGILLSKVQNSGMLTTSGWLMLVGVVLFSGSLYVMAVTGVTKLGAITPIGGLAFIVAWVLMAVVACKQFS
ncbi:uncharacterized membrane protein YgdD (TMEM256/DUF423 family) [Croceifilum oryzae]|uniref:Uncharacterized membrane protein YgdD (TMEM256/DUF423 family) n=1 Tax=Croceifilum oryzae TaxID=1553429 RepID=A0AAJ1TF67_9BACL|nr:DUF423 domain-containing protein [Croceifilum oryzae]MDQ0417768.1 uncharacterized membrane protein YgdD (TMEM256/DUF423 family) [Croceifilum oryzae]